MARGGGLRAVAPRGRRLMRPTHMPLVPGRRPRKQPAKVPAKGSQADAASRCGRARLRVQQ
jgi:hypothetical protein